MRKHLLPNDEARHFAPQTFLLCYGTSPVNFTEALGNRYFIDYVMTKSDGELR